MVLSRPYRTPLQQRLADRNLVIFAARRFGCSVRLIARALDLDPARIRQVLDEFERVNDSTAEDST